MFCWECKYNGNCQLQEIAPDLTGCMGHSKRIEKVPAKEEIKNEWIQELEIAKQNQVLKTIDDFQIGDRVRTDSNHHNLRMFNLPGYLCGSILTVVGFGKTKVKCDWDGGRPFLIPPHLLEKVKKKE